MYLLLGRKGMSGARGVSEVPAVSGTGRPKKGRRTFRAVLTAAAVFLCSFATIASGNSTSEHFTDGYLTLASLAFSIRYAPLILLSGLFGEVPGMLCVLIVFLQNLVFDRSVAFLNFIYLVVAVLVCAMSRRGVFRSVRGSLWSGLVLALLLGDVWGVLTDVLLERDLFENSWYSYLLDFLMEVPECFLSSFLLWCFFRFAPEGVRRLVPMASAEGGEVGLYAVARRGSHISRKITLIIVGEAAVLSIFAAIFSNLLLPTVMQPGEAPPALPPELLAQRAEAALEELPEGMRELGRHMRRRAEQGLSGGMGLDTGNFFRFDVHRLAFDCKLIMMIMTLAVPIAVLVNYYAQRTLAQPISRMAGYLKRFAAASEDEEAMVASAASLRELDVRNRDEIGDLYQSIDATVHQLVDNLERMKREAELENDLKVARAASEAKSGFLSNMSHEIRTPINAVLGMDEMILRESREDAVIEYALNIQNAGRSLLSLVNDILDFSKIEAGKMEILPVQYDLASTINDLVNMIAVRARDKQLSLDVHVDEAMPHLLVGDEVRIKQVVTNILTNAVKYTEQGGVTLEIGCDRVEPGETCAVGEDGAELPIEGAEDKIWLRVRVSDTGIGIREEDLGKLFSPFERIEEIRNRTIEGTGLGMSIVKKLLAMMGTRLEVRSVYGQGSDFSFRVLQEVADREPIGDFEVAYKKSVETRERYQESFRAPEARILVVDDTRMNLTVIRALLKSTRLAVDTAESGAEAIECVRRASYDALFIDHMMPEMDGLQTLAAMRALPPGENRSAEAPVIALTANAVAGARETYLAAGFTDYLSKPVDAAKLEKLLIAVLPRDKVRLPGEPGWEEASSAAAGGEEAPKETDTPVASEALRAVSHVDLAAALSATGGEEVLLEVMRDFCLAIPAKCELIEAHVREGNWREYTVQVHALKSSARLIGAQELSAEAARLEACGNAGDAEEIRRATPALLERYRAYLDYLAPVVAKPAEEEEREEIGLDMLEEARQSLREAVEAQDFDAADDIFEMLGQYRFPESEQIFWEEIRRRLSAVDREGLLALL